MVKYWLATQKQTQHKRQTLNTVQEKHWQVPEEGLDLSVVKKVNGNLDDDADKGEHKGEQ